MILSVFQTVEFYIISAFIAAAVIAAAAMPSRRSAARTFLYGGNLSDRNGPGEPAVTFIVETNGDVTVMRDGLDGITESGAYSIAVTIIGFDVTIEERLTPGRPADPAIYAGYTTMNCLGNERYHFHYKSEMTGRSAAFQLNIRPGNRITRPLS